MTPQEPAAKGWAQESWAWGCSDHAGQPQSPLQVHSVPRPLKAPQPGRLGSGTCLASNVGALGACPNPTGQFTLHRVDMQPRPPAVADGVEEGAGVEVLCVKVGCSVYR